MCAHQPIERVGQRDDARPHRNFEGGEAARIAAAIEALLRRDDDACRLFEGRHVAEDLERDLRVAAQQRDLQVRQRRRLLQQRVGQRRLAQIVEERRALERRHLARWQVQGAAEQADHLRDAPRMRRRARMPPFHRRRQRRRNAGDVPGGVDTGSIFRAAIDRRRAGRRRAAHRAQVLHLLARGRFERQADTAIRGRRRAPLHRARHGLRHRAARDRRGNLLDAVQRSARRPRASPRAAEQHHGQLLSQRLQLGRQAAPAPGHAVIGDQRDVHPVVLRDRQRLLAIARGGAVVALPFEPGRERGLQGGFGFDEQNLGTHATVSEIGKALKGLRSGSGVWVWVWGASPGLVGGVC